MNAGRYTEHRRVETGPLLVADSTMASGDRKVWCGAGGMEGCWLTHADFRAMVADLVAFADALPPTHGVAVPDHQTPAPSDADGAPKLPTCWRCTHPAMCRDNGFCSIERCDLDALS